MSLLIAAQTKAEPTIFLLAVAVPMALVACFLLRRSKGLFFAVILALAMVVMGGVTESRTRNTKRVSIEQLRVAKRQQESIRQAQTAIRSKRDAILHLRRQELEELSEKLVANVYPSAEQAASSLARQLVAHLKSDRGAEPLCFRLDSTAFVGVTDSLETNAGIAEAFMRTLNALSGDEDFEISDSRGNYQIEIRLDDVENAVTPQDATTLLLIAHSEDEQRYAIRSAFLKSDIWSKPHSHSEIVFEYGNDEREGENSCLARAVAQLTPHVKLHLQKVDVDLEHLGKYKQSFLEHVAAELQLEEFPQLYSYENNGSALEEPVAKTAMLFEHSHDAFDAAIRSSWPKQAAVSLPEPPTVPSPPDVSEIDNVQIIYGTHSPSWVPEGPGKLAYATLVFGLIFVYGTAMLLTRLYDERQPA